MLKLCRNSNFPHHTSNLYKGLCLACYKYQERTGKMRPASVIIAHLERTTKNNPMDFFFEAVNIVKAFAETEGLTIEDQEATTFQDYEDFKDLVHRAKKLTK